MITRSIMFVKRRCRRIKLLRFARFRTIIALCFLLGGMVVTLVVLKLLGQPTENSGSKNYFSNAGRLAKMDRIVDSSNCRIPDFSPFDEEILPLLEKAKPLEDCSRYYNWSHVDGGELAMHADQMEKDGYPLDQTSCCYQIVSRDTDPNLLASRLADLSVKYSECVPIDAPRTPIFAEYIMVSCYRRTGYLGTHYRAFHGTASLHKNLRRTKIQEKLDYWKEHKSGIDVTPPNILMVGIDSTSRLNFRRGMHRTREFLERMGAIEMMGYTKVGENTFPNFCSLFTGYSEEEVFDICLESFMSYADHCPWLWNQLDEARYLTAHTEDSPEFTAFNYRKAGFAEQPVDFYGRPVFLAAHDYGDAISSNFVKLLSGKAEHLDCISYQTNDEAVLSYLESTLDFAHENNAPIFSFSWSTTLPHDNFNMIQLSDDTYAAFLSRIHAKGYLNNTIIFFMGDHGYRFGKIRETLIGYYEDKLPNLWIKLPDWIQQTMPEWRSALLTNSRRLTSPYHIYWTVQHILQTFTSISSPKPANHLTSGKPMERKYSQSMFSPVPEASSCMDVGVPERFCACYIFEPVPLSSPMLRESAEKALHEIGKSLALTAGEGVCADLEVEMITAGAVGRKTTNVRKYVVSILARPGDILIEAEVDFFEGNNTFSDFPVVQRSNKINHADAKCTKDPKTELFCYCLK